MRSKVKWIFIKKGGGDVSKYEQFFEKIAESLDLNETEEITITTSYTAVGEYLAESISLKNYSPNIFPQGSMRLGTVVKPLSKDDYDIDLVCELENGESLTPEQVKSLVGLTLKNGKYSKQLEEEHGRCWTLDYSANPPYHLDILPGIGISNDRVKATIKSDSGEYSWLYTDPRGFAKWFLSIPSQRLLFEDSRNVEKISKFNSKTPLQRAVQLIKRHRDVCFKDNPENGPASIIITTLCGLSFSGEKTIEDILRNGPIKWLSYIKIKNGKYSIKVPQLPDDDYADKWNGEDKHAAERFFKWHRKLLLDLDNLFRQRTINDFLNVCNSLFTESTIAKISQTNVRIMDSLRESFEQKRYLPTLLDDFHPLFSHAKSVYRRYPFVPKKEVLITIEAKVFNSYEEAKKNENEIHYLSFSDSSLLITKEKWIRFTAFVKNPGHIDSYILFQVTNTGEEALNDKEGELRGELYPPEEGYKHTRFEQTSYRGTHFVQAFLIEKTPNKDYCIARSNILTVNVGDEL